MSRWHPTFPRPAVVAAALTVATVAWLHAASGLELKDSAGTLSLRAIAPDIVRIEYLPAGMTSRPTEILDPASLSLRGRSVGSATGTTLTTSDLRLAATPTAITIGSARGGATVAIDRALLAQGKLRLTHPGTEHLYGLRSYGLSDSRDPRLARANGLTRDLGAPIKAAAQGDGGAPLAYSAMWGLLVDSIDGEFTNATGVLEFDHGSRKNLEAYLVLGPPKRTIEMATDLTGHPDMSPLWAMGFMNSQWGSTEAEVTSIIATYRQKQIPIDAFIMDFDFKAWGEDDYGEFRWNSTSGAGSVSPNKYPDGQSGAFGKQMADQGIHLVAIMKPRVLMENVNHQPTKAAAEATAHDWWMPGKKPYADYFSKRLANDLDFAKPDVRQWYWQHARNLLDTGISGWWNDEADDGFDSLGFFHMQQSLYEGQRSASPRRVWSLNRNFYLGAQRFAFGTWSGDIGTGFKVMADQRARLLTMTDLAQPHWSMDTGGFGGHPSPENYARWMEFAAVVPIMRVHNTLGEHRQPWVYGPIAEAAAKRAIELRYALIPSLYSWEHEAHRTGVGIVRPLFWEFPADPASANVVESWMLGDALLVSPVVEEGQSRKTVYLPPGHWFDYWSGAAFEGGRTVDVQTDSLHWSDLPMFVRGGSIVATQPVVQFAGAAPIPEITLDVWPDEGRPARFDVYDDDGETYGYDRGAFCSQTVMASAVKGTVTVAFEKPAGTYRAGLERYRVRVHANGGGTATWNGRPIAATVANGTLEMSLPAAQAGTLLIRR